MTVPIASILGLTGTSFAAGYIFSVSTFTTPALIAGAQTSSGLAHAWIKAHDKAKSTSPPLAIFTTIALAIGAYHPRVNVVQRNLFGAAALLSVGILPFTLISMRNTVNALYAKLDVGPIQREIDVGIKQAELHETEILVERWSAQNTVRAWFPLIGAVATLLGILEGLS